MNIADIETIVFREVFQQVTGSTSDSTASESAQQPANKTVQTDQEHHVTLRQTSRLALIRRPTRLLSLHLRQLMKGSQSIQLWGMKENVV